MRIALTAALLVSSMSFASAASEAELKEKVATLINLNGHLCASVTDVRPLEIAGNFEITCVEYRGGSGTVRYILNAAKGIVFPA